MKDILFSSWAGTVVDNRGGSDGSTTHSDTIKKIRMPEKLTETEPIRAFMGWDGFVLRSEDVHVVDLCRASDSYPDVYFYQHSDAREEGAGAQDGV